MISSISYSPPPIGHSDHCIVDFLLFLLFIQNTADTNGGTNASRVGLQYNWHAADFGSTELYLDSTNWEVSK